MDGMEVNKLIGAFLVVGIVFFLTGLIGDHMIHVSIPEHPAIIIAGGAKPGPANRLPSRPSRRCSRRRMPSAARLTRRNSAVSPATASTRAEKRGSAQTCMVWSAAARAHVGVRYSAALKAKTGPWTYDEMYQWLKKPSA